MDYRERHVSALFLTWLEFFGHKSTAFFKEKFVFPKKLSTFAA